MIIVTGDDVCYDYINEFSIIPGWYLPRIYPLHACNLPMWTCVCHPATTVTCTVSNKNSITYVWVMKLGSIIKLTYGYPCCVWYRNVVVYKSCSKRQLASMQWCRKNFAFVYKHFVDIYIYNHRYSYIIKTLTLFQVLRTSIFHRRILKSFWFPHDVVGN